MTRFDLDVNFSGAIFTGTANFYQTIFSGKATFAAVDFSTHAFFLDAEFVGDATFAQAVFRGGTNFAGAKFLEGARFYTANFGESAHFYETTFSKYASFESVLFNKEATFTKTVFSGGADFREARFQDETLFDSTSFSPVRETPTSASASRPNPSIADFSGVQFADITRVRFYQVNKSSAQGLRIRLSNSNVEGIQILDVNWYRLPNRRMVLQDELDITEPRVSNSQVAERPEEERLQEPEEEHELVANVYRQLINTFEKMRAYDLAEDCWIGTMEMKRLDPAQLALSRSMANLYRFASFYGSSYRHALAVLLGFVLIAFPLLFSLAGLTPNPSKGVMIPDGLIHSLEAATFQSNTHYVATNGFAWGLEILERIFVPVQLSLFLLALRRRFRR